MEEMAPASERAEVDIERYMGRGLMGSKKASFGEMGDEASN